MRCAYGLWSKEWFLLVGSHDLTGIEYIDSNIILMSCVSVGCIVRFTLVLITSGQ